MALIIDTDVANSAPGIPQPVILGGPALPPSFPIAPAGTWIPPPEISNPVGVPTFPPTGGNTAPVAIPATAPAPTPVVPPGTGDPGIPQPQIASGPSLPPSFPLYTAPGPVQPIVDTGQEQTDGTMTVPMTPGTQPVTTVMPFTGIHAKLAQEMASARGVRSEPPTPEDPNWQPKSNNGKKKRR